MKSFSLCMCSVFLIGFEDLKVFSFFLLSFFFLSSFLPLLPHPLFPERPAFAL